MARAALDWSLAQLAKKAGVNPNTISRFESGRDVMSSIVAKLEEALREEGVVFLEAEEDFEPGIRLRRRAPGRRRSTVRRPKKSGSASQE
jgi:transcriptional regulator with XRE-family HTH domain